VIGKIMPVISLLTDFMSFYPGQMKAVIIGINPSAVFVDIAHDIPPQNICAGAFALMVSAPYFPAGTVHLAVVDPGVGTSRRSIIVESGGHIFVGPDNGLLIPAARRLSQNFTVREITNSTLFQNVSSTFHGRDIFAPVAAYLSRGMMPAKVGDKCADYIELDFGTPRFDNNKVLTKVVFIDGFGNVITNIPGELMLKKFDYGDNLRIKNINMPLVHTFADVTSGEPLILIGSHGYLEISVNAGSAAGLLGIGTGDTLKINRL
jgi:S-adenosylmethionine hydrolase